MLADAHLARCLGYDPELWFPDTKGSLGRAAVEAAIAICRGCVIREACLAEATRMDERHGVFGGRHFGQEPPPELDGHGTNRRYMAHLRHGDPACDRCKAAHAAYVAERNKQKVKV